MRLDTLEVAVAGGGIAGAATALALARRGARVTLFERAPALEEVGAGLQIGPHGGAVLAALGVAPALVPAATTLEGVELLDGHGGHRVAALPFRRWTARHPYLALHRADLLAALVEAARAAGVVIETAAEVVSTRERGAGVELTLADGRRDLAALVVAADGVRSGLRARLLGPEQPAFAGKVAWRALVPAEALPPWARVFMGRGRHLVTYPLAPRGVVNLVAVEESREWVAESWSEPGMAEVLTARFADFCAEARALLARAEAPMRWGLFRRSVPGHWHRGRVVFVGDAVHPTLPFLAQGAVMGLEDAWILAEALAAAPGVEGALAAFTRARLARVRRAVAEAERNARLYHLSGPARPMVHGLMRLAGRLAPGLLARRFDWLYGRPVVTVGGR